MISSPFLLIAVGCLLGAVQLAVGIAIGMWLRRTDAADVRPGPQDMVQARAIAERLRTLADEMTCSVGEHRTKLEGATAALTSREPRSDETLAELVAGVIGDIMRANQELEAKLQTAETRLKEQAAEIETHISRSLTDPLTGLPNRREFNNRLEERMSAWNRRREVFSLLLVDVDHFKKLNDVHGHLAGDQVLAMMGRSLRTAIRREDAVARYGGEEFAILLPCTALEPAVRVAENVRQSIAKIAVDHGGQRLSVTASVGLATIQANELAETLIQRADAALYAAKAGGRNCAYVHNGSDCRPANDLQAAQQPLSSSEKIVQLINSPDLESQLVAETKITKTNEFGSFLPRDEISPELVQTCEDLRKFVEERSGKARLQASGAKCRASGVGPQTDTRQPAHDT
jgi:diguanylate cyclase